MGTGTGARRAAPGNSFPLSQSWRGQPHRLTPQGTAGAPPGPLHHLPSQLHGPPSLLPSAHGPAAIQPSVHSTVSFVPIILPAPTPRPTCPQPPLPWGQVSGLQGPGGQVSPSGLTSLLLDSLLRAQPI